MRALVCQGFGSISDLVISEVADLTPGHGQAVISVDVGGINFPDTLIVEGRYQYRPEPPFTPGGEGVGTVIRAGKGVDLAVGTRVIGVGPYGAFAQQWLMPATALIPVPDWLTSQQAAGFGMTYGTSRYALHHRADLQPGETMLVLGAAGGIGTAAVELGRARGARVIAAAGSDEKLDFLREMGADEVINYETMDLKEEVKALTGGTGVDVVVDPVGGVMTEAALRATAWNGRHLIIGFAAGDIPQVPMNLPLLKGMNIMGVFWGRWATLDPAASASNFEALIEMIERGDINPRIDSIFDLADFEEAFDRMTSRRAMGKVLLNIA